MTDINHTYLSENVINGFRELEYTFETMCYSDIYRSILDVLPGESIRFDEFTREILIASEMVCSAICHKINWNFLREAVYKKNRKNTSWLNPINLSKMKVEELEEVLEEYPKKERISAKERCAMLNELGENIDKNMGSFSNIFIEPQDEKRRDLEEVISCLEKIKAFSSDPQQKKLQLLFQSLSDYHEFAYLSNVCKPTIDYHLIRLYLRRGVVRITNQYAEEYVFNKNALRKENTIATLRKVCADSLETISWISSIDLKTINRIEWWVGRTVCVNGEPDCNLQTDKSKWLQKKFEKCPYYEICYARKVDNKFLGINEPIYKGTSY